MKLKDAVRVATTPRERILAAIARLPEDEILTGRQMGRAAGVASGTISEYDIPGHRLTVGRRVFWGRANAIRNLAKMTGGAK